MKRTRDVVRHFWVPTLLALMTTFVLNSAAFAQLIGDWDAVGSLNVPREGHTATLLADGRVLVAGGRNGNILDSTELFDPATETWSLAASLNTPRFLHTATLLPNGKVLVAGGITNSNSAELYDPATGTWSVTGSLNIGRFWYTATLLTNGKVLVVAGAGGENSAELYDPTTGTWSITGSLNTARYGHTATLLQDGKVLIAGGSNDGDLASVLKGAELYDPATGTWSITGDLNSARISHTATLLPNGKVLVAAGYTPNFVPAGGTVSITSPTSLSGAELYDPTTGTWSVAANLKIRRDSHTATLLQNGSVLVVGGGYWTADGSTPNNGRAPCFPCSFKSNASGELYDPVTGEWAANASLNTGRNRHTATLLQSGQVLVAGGENNVVTVDGTELYDNSVPGQEASPSIAATWLESGETGIPFTSDLKITGGIPPYIVSITKGKLPAGLSLGNDGIISGTPSPNAKSATITVRVTDSLNESVTQNISITVVKAVRIEGKAKAGRVGRDYRAFFKNKGGLRPLTWSITSGTLPSGLSFDTTTGAITGVPTEVGEFPLTVQVTDGLSGIDSETLTLTIR